MARSNVLHTQSDLYGTRTANTVAQQREKRPLELGGPDYRPHHPML